MCVCGVYIEYVFYVECMCGVYIECVLCGMYVWSVY